MFAEPCRYEGEKTGCDFCKRKFKTGEPILLDRRQGLIFCSTDPSSVDSCVIHWALANGRAVSAESAEFRGGQKIPGYGGEISECSGCRREFSHGETIHLDLQRVDSARSDTRMGVAFCDNNGMPEDCLKLWKERIGQPEAVCLPEPRKFHGNT